MDRNTFAVRALFRTLRDKLPAKLAALDAARVSKVVCRPGPYVIPALPAPQTLTVNGATYALTTGTRTAAQVATDLASAVAFTASVDADGALLLTANAAPSAGQSSQLTIGAGTTNAVFGLVQGDSDVVKVSLSATPVRFLERTLETSDVAQRLAPIVGVNRDTWNPGVNLNNDLSEVSVRLWCLFPGPAGRTDPTLEAVKELAGAIYQVVAEGDGRGTYMVGRSYANDDGKQVVVCRPNPMTIEASVLSANVAGSASLTPVGQAFPTFTIQVFDAT